MEMMGTGIVRALCLCLVATVLFAGQASGSFATWYIAPDFGSVDLEVCGRTRSLPCMGLLAIIDAGCASTHIFDVTHTEIRLLPGRYVLPVFSGPKILSSCNNFSVVSDNDTALVTIVADPFHVLSPENGTYHPDVNKIGNSNADQCGLNDAANLFGAAAFAFANSTNVLLKNLRFEMVSDFLDVFVTLTSVGNFNMENCHFLNLPTLRQAVGILNPVGKVIISGCTFEKQDHKSSEENTYESSFNNLQIQAAVYIFQTVPAPKGIAAIFILNNNFTIQRSQVALPWTYEGWKTFITRTQQQSLCRTSGDATLLRIRMDAYARGMQISISQNNFIANGPRFAAQSIGSAVSIAVKCNAFDNSIIVSDSSFENHVAQQGSGIQVSVTGNAAQNAITLYNLKFINNGLQNWTQEGGALRIFTTDSPFQQNVVYIEKVYMVGNQALFGSAIYLEHRYKNYQGCAACIDPYSGYKFCDRFTAHFLPTFEQDVFPRRQYFIMDAVVRGNMAQLGTVHTKHVILTVVNGSFSDNVGGALYLSDSVLRFFGLNIIANNTATQGAGVALHHGSSILINTTSSAFYNRLNTVNFLGNFAHTRGGAIYVDQQSSTLDYNDVVESGLSHLQFDFDCFIDTPSLFFADACVFDGTVVSPGYLNFDGNMACLQGQDIYAFSLLQCSQASLVPATTGSNNCRYLVAQTGSTPDKLFKARRLTSFADTKGVRKASAMSTPAISTGPNYIQFIGATCPCRKTIGDAQYLFSNCTAKVTGALFNRTKNLRTTSQVLLNQLPQFQISSSVGDSRPPNPTFWLPWAGTFVTDQDAKLFTSIADSDPGDLLSLGIEPSELVQDPSHVMLMPAPGERFSLDIRSVDQLLGDTRSPAYLQVAPDEHTFDRAATLLRQGSDFQLSHDDKIYFVPGKPIVGISIVGMPGTIANLKVVVPSQLTDKDIELLIPFQLSPCPYGYDDPTLYDPHLPVQYSFKTAAKEIGSYSSMVIPESWHTGNDPVACNCNPSGAGISSCSKGKELQVAAGYWGAIVPSVDMHQAMADEYACNNTEVNITGMSFAEMSVACLPASADAFEYMVTMRNNSGFLYAECLHDVCGYGLAGNAITVTGIFDQLAQGELVSTPCTDHTKGVECGRCKEGYSLTPYYVFCTDCTGKLPWRIILVTTMTGVLIMAAGIGFTWGVSPSLVSVLFFCQAVALVVRANPKLPHGQEFITQSLNLDLSYGMCFMENFTALDRLLWAYFPPVYFLSLLFICYLLSNAKCMVKIFARRNCIRMFWLVIILSYGSLARTTVRTLRCTDILPTARAHDLVTSSLRLMDDEDVICWQGRHLYAGIVALLIIVFILVPMPIVLPYLHKWPRFKPFSDVYNSLYRTERRLMSGVDLFRRLLLAVAVATPLDPKDQYMAGLVTCVVCLAAHAVFQPYDKPANNILETLLLMSLCIISALAVPKPTSSYYLAIQIVFFLTLGSLAIYKTWWVYQQNKMAVQRVANDKFGIQLKCYQIGQNRETKRHIRQVSQLRDPLMEEHFDISVRHDSTC